MKSLLLALVLVVAVYGKEFAHPVPDDDRPLQRCKRVLCTHDCTSGFRVDAQGCETCICDDRCEHHVCVEGTKCAVEDDTAICKPETECPLMNCAMHCAFGFRQGEDGCDICECKKTPCDGYTCPQGMKCISKTGECDQGKGTCNLKALCLPDHIDEPPPLPCAIPMCAIAHECEFGFKLSEHGCQTCQCRESPCDTEQCGDGEMCIEHPVKCNRNECPNQPKCVGRPLCHRQAEQHHLATSLLMPGPVLIGSSLRARRATKTSLDCDVMGAFKPLQCSDDTSECWCVDDRGIEIPNSRKVTKEGERPECHYNRTKGVHGSFKLSHSLEDVAPHLNNIKKLAHQHLSNWLHMEEEYVTIVEITPHQSNIIQVHFEVMWDEETDMATAIYHVQYLMLKGHCQINYQGGTLVPDPKSMDVHHHYEPKLPNESGWTGAEHYPRHGHGFMGFVHRHQTGIIAAVFGATMLILLVAIVSFARRRRLSAAFNHRRMDTYRENLAFSNQLYGKQNLMGEEIKEPLSQVEVVVPADAQEKKPEEAPQSVA